MEIKNLELEFKSIVEKHFPDFFSHKNTETWNDYISNIRAAEDLLPILERSIADVFRIRIFFCWWKRKEVYPAELELISDYTNLDFPDELFRKSSLKVRNCFFDFIELLNDNDRIGSERSAKILHLLPRELQGKVFEKFVPYTQRSGGIFGNLDYSFLYLISNLEIPLKYKILASKKMEGKVLEDIEAGHQAAFQILWKSIDFVYVNHYSFSYEFLMDLAEVMYESFTVVKKSDKLEKFIHLDNFTQILFWLRFSKNKKVIDFCFKFFKTYCNNIEDCKKGLSYKERASLQFLLKMDRFFLSKKSDVYTESTLKIKVDTLITEAKNTLHLQKKERQKQNRKQTAAKTKASSALDKMLV